MLLHTINRAKQRLFFHFHDAGEFKEEEHPRKGGKFVKKGTGSSGVKPKAAPGATVVNPVAVALKSHGYEKQKGSNTFKHPSGHEVEVHAASEGQKWLTGWTHGTTGQTGSGAGKLDKHLQSVGGTAPSKAQAAPAATPSPKPTSAPSLSPAAGPHPLNNVHLGVSKLGFEPFSQTKSSTMYKHPDTGDEVVIMNDTPKKGIHKKHVAWTYYPKGGGGLVDGHGIANGSLEQAVDNNKYQQQQQKPAAVNPYQPIKEYVVKPAWAKYPNEEPAKFLFQGQTTPEPVIRYFTGPNSAPDESLVIGTGPNNKGMWQLYTKKDGVVATGSGQDDLNAAFEKLHPRGAGGEFIAKPDQVDQSDHDALIAAGYKPLAKTPWVSGENNVHIYGKEDGSILLTKPGKGIFPPAKEAFANHPDFFNSILGGKTPKIGEPPTVEQITPKEVFKPLEGKGFSLTSVNPDNGVVSGYLKSTGGGPSLSAIYSYDPEQQSGTVQWQHPGETQHEQTYYGTPKQVFNQINQKMDIINPLAAPMPAPSSTVNKATMTSLFKPLVDQNFTFHSGDNGEIAGHLKDHPNDLKMVFTYNSTTQKGTIAWQQAGGSPSQNEEISGSPGQAFTQIQNKYEELHAASDAKPEGAIGRPISLSALTKIGEQMGSNPGGTYHSLSGKQYYVKIPKTSEHASNELLAAELMSRAGGGTFMYHAINGDEGKINVGTELQTLQKKNVSELSPEERKKAQSDFAINAWLANWDAAGLTGDNIGVANGKVLNLDLGGSLLYRAQGSPKGAAFTSNVGEWDSLRDPTKNAAAAKLYGDMTPIQMKQSADKLKKITDSEIQNAVSNWFDSETGIDLVQKLIARRDDILKKAEVMSTTTPPAQKAQPAPTQNHQAGTGTKVEGGVGLVTSPTEPTKTYSQVYSDLSKDSTVSAAVESHLNYYKSSGYVKINDCMRISDNCDHIKQVKPIRDWIKNSKRTSKPLTLFRGVRNKHGFTDAVKQQIQYAQSAGLPFRLKDDAFISMSTNHQTAAGFAGHDGMTFIIEVPEGSHGASVHNDYEHEVMFQQGSRLIVTGEKDPVTGYWKARLDQSHLSEGSN